MAVPLVHQIAGYRTSRDYARLVELMQRHSVVCVVDSFGDSRDVARTVFEGPAETGLWMVSARGIGYLHARSREEFIAQCAKNHLEFLEPTA